MWFTVPILLAEKRIEDMQDLFQIVIGLLCAHKNNLRPFIVLLLTRY